MNKKANAKNSARPKKGRKPIIDKQIESPDASIRLNKYIANSGICSRRDADIYIASGNVTVNGKVITEMGYKVKLTDNVKFDGNSIIPERKEYVLLNKPSGFYVTGSLEKNNRTVMDLIAKTTATKLSPVGKLENSASGLLLFTNDGTLAKNLGKYQSGIRQIFQVALDKPLSYEDKSKIEEGVGLEDGIVKVDEISFIQNKTKRDIGIELKSTKAHIVQRLFKKLGYEVVNLDRVVYGELTKKDLPRGFSRHLTKQEVINLGMMIGKNKYSK